MKCNNNDEEIVLKKTCYVIGPTGQTGATGPQGMASARISVGSTTTIEPDEEASVYNGGTDNDVLLNFLIPRGHTGPTPNFVIGSVTTGEPDSKAEVKITPIYDNEEDINNG